MRKGQGAQRALDGERVERETGWCGGGDGDVEVGGPADAFGVDPIGFIWGRGEHVGMQIACVRISYF